MDRAHFPSTSGRTELVFGTKYVSKFGGGAEPLSSATPWSRQPDSRVYKRGGGLGKGEGKGEAQKGIGCYTTSTSNHNHISPALNSERVQYVNHISGSQRFNFIFPLFGAGTPGVKFVLVRALGVITLFFFSTPYPRSQSFAPPSPRRRHPSFPLLLLHICRTPPPP